jgi:hypothetical protein
MKKRRRIILTVLIPILTIIYATFEYIGLADRISGRKIALDGLSRLSSPRGYPEIIIFNDEREFGPILKLIISNTENKEVKILYRSGKVPTAVVRLGGTLSPPGAWDERLPKVDVDPRFVPETSPVLLFYNYGRGGIRDNVPENERIAKAACSLGDIRRWIDSFRNRERFLLSTLLIGLLSIVVAILGWADIKKKNA